MHQNIDKKLDKLYFKVLELCDEKIAVKIVTLVQKNGYINSLKFALKVEDVKVARILLESGQKIKYFKDMISSDLNILIMSCLDSPYSMNLILNFESELPDINNKGKLDETMLVSIYRHTVCYPENKDICMNLISRFNLSNLFEVKPFMFFRDDVDIIQKYINKKNQNIRQLSISNSISCDSVKTLKKLISYYQLDDCITAKLSLPELLNRNNSFNLFSENMRDSILHETCIYSKWDFLPYIFNNYTLTRKDWIHFQFGLYHGRFTILFIRTLFHLMKTHNYAIGCLVGESQDFIQCTKEVMNEFVKNGYDKHFKFVIRITVCSFPEDNIASMFQDYYDHKVNSILEYMFISFAHINGRFIKELEFVKELVDSNQLGWMKNETISFNIFYQICKTFINQLILMDLAVLKCNAFISIRANTNYNIALRFLNDIKNTLNLITNKYLLEKYTDMIDSVNLSYKDFIGDLRENFNIDLPCDVKYELSENPTLEELFIYIYHYSPYSREGTNNDKYLEIVDILKKKKFNKILNETECAVAHLIDYRDITKILQIKNII